MPLSSKNIKHLRALAHNLKPLISVGQKGLSDSLLSELDTTLDHHELVKLRLCVDDREVRRAMIDELCVHSKSELVQSVGKTATVFRRNNEKPVIQFGKL